MTTTIKAKYKNGALELFDPVNLHDGDEVIIRFVKAPNTIPTIDNETRQRLDVVAQETADRIATLESDRPEDEVANWHDAMNRAAKPARYVPRQGIVIEPV